MKTVYPSKEIYHLWAHQTQEHARNGAGNVSFRGGAAYSYAARIGNIVRGELGGQCALITPRKWTVTTSGHQSMLRQAVPDWMPVYNVPNMDDQPDHVENLTHYAAEVEELAGKISRARTNRPWLESQAADLQTEANDYCRFFGLANAFDPAVVAQAQAQAEISRKEREAEQERRAQERAERHRREDAGKVAGWLAGEAVELSYYYPDTLLRLASDGAEVETSRGARVPVTHARRLYEKLHEGALRPGDRAGHYTVDRVAEDAVQIGCHYITLAEVERFAVSVGWTGVAA